MNQPPDHSGGSADDGQASQGSVSAKPISAAARRVLGVLVEKAKTTPDNYPLSLAAVISGSNQKSNRSPKMDLEEDDALLALDELRACGAALEVQGSGRVTKYRHAMYQWMDVDGPGSAIMTELLLRGPQTLGELRTRASRMHAFDQLPVVQACVDDLIAKGLVEPLSPPGRGQTFAHTLYPPQERQYLNARVEKLASKSSSESSAGLPAASGTPAVDGLLSRLDSVNQRIDALEKRIAQLESNHGPTS